MDGSSTLETLNDVSKKLEILETKVEFSKSSSFILHTGNIVSWNRLRRKSAQSPSDELLESIAATLDTWLDSFVDDTHEQCTRTLDLQTEDLVEVCNRKYIQKIQDSERDHLKLSVKLFLHEWDSKALREGVARTLCDLGANSIDSLIIAFPQEEFLEEEIPLEQIKPFWLVLEELVASDKVLSLGVSDLDKKKLEELFNWAKVKPNTDHWNLALCCTMPEDLVEFAKNNDIQLLSHNDHKVFLKSDDFQRIVSSRCGEEAGKNWEASWVVRYSVMIRQRGIIKTKGYIVKAKR